MAIKGAEANNHKCTCTGSYISSVPNRTRNASHKASQTRITSVTTWSARLLRRGNDNIPARNLSIIRLLSWLRTKPISLYCPTASRAMKNTNNVCHPPLFHRSCSTSMRTRKLSAGRLQHYFLQSFAGLPNLFAGKRRVHQEHKARFP
ncbi:hypothetical protein D3C78_1457930 [compost metagenome]